MNFNTISIINAVWSGLIVAMGEAFEVSVGALKIYQELYNASLPAVRHYEIKGDPKDILGQGAADFDQKWVPNNPNEQPHYRTELYVGTYMDMHLKQSMHALQTCLPLDVGYPLLFIDYGCGPMTAGLALADMLSRRTDDYRSKTAYVGIDASQNMINKAKSINEQYQLFDQSCFIQSKRFEPDAMPAFSAKPQTAILMLCFVLAPDTFKTDAGDDVGAVVKTFADDWKDYVNRLGCHHIYIVYMNPKSQKVKEFHNNYWAFEDSFIPKISFIDPAEFLGDSANCHKNPYKWSDISPDKFVIGDYYTRYAFRLIKGERR